MLCFEVQVVVRLSLISLNSEELTLLVPEEEEVEKTCFQGFTCLVGFFFRFGCDLFRKKKERKIHPFPPTIVYCKEVQEVWRMEQQQYSDLQKQMRRQKREEDQSSQCLVLVPLLVYPVLCASSILKTLPVMSAIVLFRAHQNSTTTTGTSDHLSLSQLFSLSLSLSLFCRRLSANCYQMNPLFTCINETTDSSSTGYYFL